MGEIVGGERERVVVEGLSARYHMFSDSYASQKLPVVFG